LLREGKHLCMSPLGHPSPASAKFDRSADAGGSKVAK
jgi:hypothetical protein